MRSIRWPSVVWLPIRLQAEAGDGSKFRAFAGRDYLRAADFQAYPSELDIAKMRGGEGGI